MTTVRAILPSDAVSQHNNGTNTDADCIDARKANPINYSSEDVYKLSVLTVFRFISERVKDANKSKPGDEEICSSQNGHVTCGNNDGNSFGLNYTLCFEGADHTQTSFEGDQS